MAVEARLADQELQRTAQPLTERAHSRLHLGEATLVPPAGCIGHAGRRTVLTEHLAQHARPLADRAARFGELDRGRREVLVGGGDPAHAVQCALPRVVVALRPPLLEVLDLLGLGRRVELEDVRFAALVRRHERGRCRLREHVHADDRELARLDLAHPLGIALHEPALHGVDHLEGPATVEHPLELGLGGVDELTGLRLDDLRAREQVVVLEQVGLVCEDLLHAQ